MLVLDIKTGHSKVIKIFFCFWITSVTQLNWIELEQRQVLDQLVACQLDISLTVDCRHCLCVSVSLLCVTRVMNWNKTVHPTDLHCLHQTETDRRESDSGSDTRCSLTVSGSATTNCVVVMVNICLRILGIFKFKDIKPYLRM